MHFFYIRKITLIKTFLFFLLFFLFCFSPIILANNLTALSAKSNDGTTQINLNFKTSPQYKIFQLANPERLVIDINDCTLAQKISKTALVNSSIKNVRIGEQANNALRIVFDLRSPLAYASKIVDTKLIVFLKSSLSKKTVNAVYYPKSVNHPSEVGISFSPVKGETKANKINLAENNSQDEIINNSPVTPKKSNKEIGISFSSNKNAKTPIAQEYVAKPEPEALAENNSAINKHDYLIENNKSLSFTTSDFGWQLPLSLGVEYSQNFGTELDGSFTYGFGFSDAVAAQFNAGTNEYRFNGTFGHALTDFQRVKVSAEYLAQNLNFDFKAGPLDKWVGQGAAGITYEYLFPQHFFHDLNVNAFYSKAWSKDLGYVYFFDPTNLNNDLGISEDWRRIAGATDKSASVGVDLLPFNTTLFGLQANYDNVHYDMQYPITPENPDPSASGLGGTLSLEQLLGKRLKIKLLGSVRKIYDDYTAELDWLALTNADHHLELAFTGEHLANNHDEQSVGNNNSSDNRFGVNFTYKLGNGISADKDDSYTLNITDSHSDLVSWSSQPAVRMAKVLAAKDEKIFQIASPELRSGTMYCTFGQPCNFDLNQFITFNSTQLTDIENQAPTASLANYEDLQNYGLHFQLINNGQNAVLVGTPTRETKGRTDLNSPDYRLADQAPSPIPVIVTNAAGSDFGTLQLNIGANNPVISQIPTQTFAPNQSGISVDLTPYINFGSVLLRDVNVLTPADLNAYGLSIDLSTDFKSVILSGTTKAFDSPQIIPVQIQVTNSAGKVSDLNSGKFTIVINPQPVDKISSVPVSKQFGDGASSNVAAIISNDSGISSVTVQPGAGTYGFSVSYSSQPGNVRQVILTNAAPLQTLTPKSQPVLFPIHVVYNDGTQESDNLSLTVKAKPPTILTTFGPFNTLKYKSLVSSQIEVAKVDVGGEDCSFANGDLKISSTNWGGTGSDHGLSYDLFKAGDCFLVVKAGPAGLTSTTVDFNTGVLNLLNAKYTLKNDRLPDPGGSVSGSFDYSIDAGNPVLKDNVVTNLVNVPVTFPGYFWTDTEVVVKDTGGVPMITPATQGATVPQYCVNNQYVYNGDLKVDLKVAVTDKDNLTNVPVQRLYFVKTPEFGFSPNLSNTTCNPDPHPTNPQIWGNQSSNANTFGICNVRYLIDHDIGKYCVSLQVHTTK